MPFKKPFFTPKERGPIKKRVAPSDSSKNFGLGGMSPKFFYRYCNAYKKPIFLSSWFKKLKNRRYLLLEDPYSTGYTLTIKKNFADIPPRPKFFEESDGATRFLIGPRSFGVKKGG